MWSYGGLLLKQSREAALVVGYGFQGIRNPTPSSPSPSLLGIRAFFTTQQCGGISRNPYFLPLLSLGSIRAFSSIDSNSSKSAGAGGRKEDDNGNGDDDLVGEADAISFSEAKRLMRLVNVEALKLKLGAEGKEVISYGELLEACESIGVARSQEEAAAFARILDEAGVVLLFRDKVYLHPDKVQIKLLLLLHEFFFF